MTTNAKAATTQLMASIDERVRLKLRLADALKANAQLQRDNEGLSRALAARNQTVAELTEALARATAAAGPDLDDDVLYVPS